MKIFKKIIVLTLLLSLIQFTVYAKTTVPPESWEMTFKTDDVLMAARQAALIYDASGAYPDATFETCGIHVLDKEEKDNTITLSLYIAHGIFQVIDGSPKEIAGGSHPVKMTFLHSGDTFTLTKYQRAGDGTYYSKGIKSIFKKSIASDIFKNEFEYYKLADNDAIQIAERYIAANEEEKKSLPCYTFLDTGTNPRAGYVITSVLPGFPSVFPSYVGKFVYIWDNDDSKHVLYKLSIEGEQSYSGTLTYEAFNLKGERIIYVKLRADGDKLNILDGKLPIKKY